MSVLGKKDILNRLKNNDLIITPLLNPKAQLQSTGIDIHLSNEIICFRQEKIGIIDPLDEKPIKKSFLEHIKIDFGQPFYLHPRQFILGSTLEFIKLPEDVCASVIGRSTYGRLGLIIATAIHINAGFKGTITLELTNVGEIPIALYPCMRIGQLILHEVKGYDTTQSRYHLQMGPLAPKLSGDKELLRFKRSAKKTG